MLTDVSDANKSYTKLEVAEKSDLDLIAVKVLRKDCPDFLFPLKMMEIDGETEIRYELTDGVRFCYMPTQMKKREFIELLTNLIQPFSEEKKSYYDWQVGNGEGVLGKMDASDGQIRNARIIKAK